MRAAVASRLREACQVAAGAGLVGAVVGLDEPLRAVSVACAVVLVLTGAPRVPLDAAAVGVAATWWLSSWLSPFGGSAIPALSLVVIVCGVARLPGHLARTLVAAVLSVAVLILALVALVALSNPGDVRAASYPGLEDWGGYPEVGLLAVMVLPIAVSVMLHEPRRQIRLSAAAAALTIGAALYLSVARGAWIAGAAGVAIVVATGRLRRALVFAAGAAVVLLALSSQVSRLALYTQPLLTRDGNVPVGSRLEAWQRAGRLWRERPHLGSGPGTYQVAYRQRFSDGTSGAQFHAHSHYLHLAVETGWIGAGSALVFCVVVLVSAGRRATSRLPSVASALRVGLAAALVGVALRLFVDYFDPAGAPERVLIVLAVLAGSSVALANAESAGDREGRSPAAAERPDALS